MSVTKETACPLANCVKCGDWCEWFVVDVAPNQGNCVIKTLTGVIQILPEMLVHYANQRMEEEKVH